MRAYLGWLGWALVSISLLLTVMVGAIYLSCKSNPSYCAPDYIFGQMALTVLGGFVIGGFLIRRFGKR